MLCWGLRREPPGSSLGVGSLRLLPFGSQNLATKSYMCSEEVLNWYFLLMDTAAVSNRYMSRVPHQTPNRKVLISYSALQ